MDKILRIATRKSPLALWQADFVKSQLQFYNPELKVELVKMSTEGDRVQNTPLSKVGGKGLFIKELEIANSAVTASEEISSVGKRRSTALRALQVEETAGGGYQPRVDYSNQSIIDALAMSARSQQGTFQATEWLNEIARSVFQKQKEKASGSETRRKYTPPSRAYEGGKRFNQDAKWCYKCFVNKDHDIRFRGYNQLDITGLHSHDQDHCPGRPSKKARKAANGI